MSRQLLFPEPTRRGDRWDVYAGEQTIISPSEAVAIGHEALWLCAQQEPLTQPYCDIAPFTPTDGEGDDYTAYRFLLRDDIRAHLLDERSDYSHIYRRIPQLLGLISTIEAVTGSQNEDFLINDLPAGGMLGRHKDYVTRTVVAINLIGSGWVTLSNTSRSRYRFRTDPGNGMVLHNFGPEELRPDHSVSARGDRRLSFAI